MSEPKKILFNKPEDGNHWLTNFETGYPIKARLPSKLTSEGKIAADSVFLTEELEWETSEHLFQALKYSQADGSQVHLVGNIQTLSTPKEAQRFTWGGNNNVPPLRADWHAAEYKLNAMRWVIREKFTQHSELKQQLINTKDAELVEETGGREYVDKYWGLSYGVGDNWLGRILMEIRQEIIAEPTMKPEKPEPKTKPINEKKQSLIEENIQAIRTKLQSAGISAEQEIQILGNGWETNYRTSWVNYSEEQIENDRQGVLKKINEFITKNSNNNNGNSSNEQNQNEEKQETNNPKKQPTPSKSSESPESTQQQLNNAEDKLNQAQESDNEEDIIKILQEISNTIKNSGDKKLKKQKEEIEKKLSKGKLREIVREEIKTVLTEEGIKLEELSPPVKQKLDELNNNNNNDDDDDDDQATRTEIFIELGKVSLNRLINEVEQALKSGKKVLASKVAELKKFINSKADYKQNAYKLQKDKVEKLLTQAQQGQSNQNKDNGGFFRPNNPLMWLSGVAVIGLVIGVSLLVIRVRRKAKARMK